jgi:hypothetical protein
MQAHMIAYFPCNPHVSDVTNELSPMTVDDGVMEDALVCNTGQPGSMCTTSQPTTTWIVCKVNVPHVCQWHT